MNKLLLLSAFFIISNSAIASTINTFMGETLVGQELLNENRTGKTCYVVVRNISASSKGLHCYDVEAQLLFARDFISKDPVTLNSRITNYHRSEYPGMKTCAENVNGTSFGNEIYGSDTSDLYTPFFSAANKANAKHFDYFLSIDPKTKKIKRSRVHVMNAAILQTHDCVDLKNVNEQSSKLPAQQQGCDIWFAKHGLCGRIYMMEKPSVGRNTPLQIVLTDSKLNPIDPTSVSVDLWMNMENHEGHGSAPITTTRLTNGVYRSENVYFIMEGTWDIRVTLGHGTSEAETAVKQITVR